MKTADVKTAFSKYIENTPNTEYLGLYIITKGTGRKPEHKLYPNHVRIKKDTKDIMQKSFTANLTAKYENLVNDQTKLRDLISEDAQNDDYRFLEKDKNRVISSFIDKIIQDYAETPIEGIDNMVKSNMFCVELINKDKSTGILFSSIPYIKVKDSEGISVTFKNKALEYIENDIVVFSNQIDALYLVDSKVLVIFNESNIKKMFGFDEYYKNLSVNAILGLDSLVETTKDFLEKNLVNKKIIEDVAKMHIERKFDKTIDNYKEYDKIFKANKNLDPKFTAIDITKDNKLRLDTKDKIYTFARTSKRNILQDPLDNEDLYIVYGKKPMKK